MARTSQNPERGPDEIRLLKDIAESRVRSEARLAEDAELMRLSSDPLLLHEYLHPGAGSPSPNENELLPFRLPMIGCTTQPSGRPAHHATYLLRESLLLPSLHPEKYCEAPQDLNGVLDLGEPQSAFPSRRWREMVRILAGGPQLVLAVVIILAVTGFLSLH